MLSQWKLMTKITDVGVVAVVRANSGEEAIEISKACLKGGIPAIEVTFTVPMAHKVIEQLSEHFSDGSMIVGAGTVLDSETARIAILAGAQYIVSPHFNKEVALLCNTYKVPYLAGCMTITEIVEAMSYGVDVCKLFPGSAFGPSYVKAVKGPLPQANIMPTGGVSLDNVHEWIEAGCVAVGVGGQLTKPALTGDYEGVTKLAKEFVKKVKEARK